MRYNKFFFSSILLLALATGTAGANNPNVSTVKIPRRQPAPIIKGNGTSSTLYEGVKWNGNSVITWSIANSRGTADSPFSGYIGSQYEDLVQQAFQTWAGASSLTFEEVADSSQSDIRLGWGDLNTPSTGVVGYTLWFAQSGQLLPAVSIRLEDPAQDALVVGTGKTLTYSGTDASLYQVMLHEIGHALGLADNDDPNSVMYYKATGTNNTLANNDVTGIQTLYGPPRLAAQALQAVARELPGTSLNSRAQELSQAIGSFPVSIGLKGSEFHQPIASGVFPDSAAEMR